MKSLWNDREAVPFARDPLALRVYTSRLLGQDPDLVLHGGGNTSVKHSIVDIFGDSQEVLYVKGSGWDLATIEAAGFAPVRLDVLQRLAEFKTLSDSEMVRIQRSAMTDPSAPNPSVEAVLHAIIPFKFVDHTHADAVVAVTNTPGGERRIREIYGERVLIVPYVMPGFILARKVYEMTRNIPWNDLEGIILLNHGVFSFGNEAKESYERMIALVSRAEKYLRKEKALKIASAKASKPPLLELAQLRCIVSQARGSAVLARLENSSISRGFADLPLVASIATRGPLTPDHVIRTKRIPVVLEKESANDVADFVQNYRQYFKRHAGVGLKCLNPAPCWAVWPGQGVVSFGVTMNEVAVVSDIVRHSIRAIQWAENLGGWKALPEKDIFDMEYWTLEQAKLGKMSKRLPLQGKVALVTGAASGIGRACVEMLAAQGAAVAALDRDKEIKNVFGAQQHNVLSVVCDVTDQEKIRSAVDLAIEHFGGLDILVSNAGIFPSSEKIGDMTDRIWEQSLDVNLTAHQRLWKAAVPFLSFGIDPAIIVIGSKNVPAPGPGVSAYSVAKAGLTQLARVAALELAASRIRVNVIHPNQVFDTAIWTPEILEKRAKHYGVSVEEYKTNNLLKTEITSQDVARMVCAVAGPLFAKTTGAQIPVDGGNDRVI